MGATQILLILLKVIMKMKYNSHLFYLSRLSFDSQCTGYILRYFLRLEDCNSKSDTSWEII